MKFGIAVGNFGTFAKHGDAKDLIEVACCAERLGFDSVWVHDHLFMPATIRSRYPYNDAGVAGFAYRQDIYDPLATLAAIAVTTKRVMLGTSVLIVPYRNPVVLAKMLATIDQLSHGRLTLGIGVGWMREEFEALGIGELYDERGRVTDEWMRICIELWTNPSASTFDGRYHRFESVGAFPKPVQKPHLPLWVGGKGEIAARRVARYGSGYHTITSTPTALAEEIEVVHRALEKAGRDPAEITVSMLGPMLILGEGAGDVPGSIHGSTQKIIDGLATYDRVGLEHALTFPTWPGIPVPTPARYMEGMHYVAEEILPALR